MTALDFPSSPSNGDIYEDYKYNSAKGAWLRIKDPIPAEKFFIGETAPIGPTAGQFWLDSSDGIAYAYYDDGDSEQWIQFGVGREGPTGPQGLVGDTGPTGPEGSPSSAYKSIVTTTAASFTPTASNVGDLISVNRASLCTITMDLGVLEPTQQLAVLRFGSGAVAIEPGAGVALVSVLTRRSLAYQYSIATIIGINSSTYLLVGDLV
jgi:hypothetical protein